MKNSILIAFLLLGLSCFSQKLIQDQFVWLGYSGQYKVSKHWGFQVEAQFRMDNDLEQSRQNLFRVGGIYYLSPSQHLSAGYNLVNTYVTKFNEYSSENRLWEQFVDNKRWGKNHFNNRFRLEQRWVEKLGVVGNGVGTIDMLYQNRLRYQNRNLFHLVDLKGIDTELYAVVQDEIFVTLGNNKINANFFDQNWFLAGFGLNYHNNTRFEIGYFNQFLNPSKSTDIMYHSVFLSVAQNLDFYKH